MHGCSLNTNRSQTALDLPRPQERDRERSDPAPSSNASSRSSSLFSKIPEISMDINLSYLSCNDNAANRSPSRNSSIVDHDQGAENATSQSRNFHVKNERNTKNPKVANHQKRSDSDVGRAMLVIVIVIVLCYIPILVEDLLRDITNIKNVVLDCVARILILINASCNAIILTVFSTDIRNLAKRLCSIKGYH